MKNFREKLNSKIYTFLENQPFLVYVLGFKKYYKIQYLGFKSVGETLKDAEENLIFMLGEKNLINKENVLENTTISLFYKRK